MNETMPDFSIDPTVATTLNAAPYPVLLVDDDGRIVLDNPKADVLFGYARGSLTGRPIEDLMPERFRQKHVTQREGFVRHHTARPVGKISNLAALRNDGTEMTVEISLRRIALRDRAVTLAVVVHLDEQHVAPPDESSLRTWTDPSGELYHRLVHTAPIGIYRSSPEGLLLYANPALAHTLGYHEVADVLGMNLPQDVYVDSEERVRVIRAIEEDAGPAGIYARLRRPDGSTITVRITSHPIRDDAGAVICYEGAVDDVTDRLRVEGDLQRMRRMESMARLAGGMSHTLNNVLTSVLGSVQLALEALPGDVDAAHTDLDEAERGLLRATEMLEKLRAFSTSEVGYGHLDLRAFILEWSQQLEPGPGITMEVSVPDEEVEVDVDREGVITILENLVSNAVDAMPEGGKLSVALSTSIGKDGRWAEIQLVDTGVGMAEATLEHAMEPYYSTKVRQMASGGAGLGLSLVYGIVRQHGGDVVLMSKPGRGTTVKLWLPLRAE